MRLTVFGATGGVGREIAAQALAAGHEVVGVSRSRGEEPRVRWVQGDLLDPAVAEQAVDGAEAVLSALGIKRKNPANPWSPLASPPDFTSRSAEVIAGAMKAAGVDRVVAISAAGVGESWARVNLFVRALVLSSNIAPMWEDLDRMEAVWRRSGLDWCCARPVTLRNGPGTGRIVEVDRFGTAVSIARADVAAWMLAAVAAPEVRARTAMIASADSAVSAVGRTSTADPRSVPGGPDRGGDRVDGRSR